MSSQTAATSATSATVPGSGEGPSFEAPSFERAIAELETIVERMEDGTLSLEDSLAAYRRGAALVKVCEGALEHAKEQVRVLDGDLLKPLAAQAAQPDAAIAR